MSWINKILPSVGRSDESKASRAVSPKAYGKKCPRCEAVLYRDNLDENLDVCPKVRPPFAYFSAPSSANFSSTRETQEELGADILCLMMSNLSFRDLKKIQGSTCSCQLKKPPAKTMPWLSLKKATLNGRPNVVVAAFEFGFIGGSMGAVVGEKFTLAVEQVASLKTCRWFALPPAVARACRKR